MEAAQRAAKRQAAPFSRGTRKPSGRPPGRRSGEQHGRHAHRQVHERVDEELSAELPDACPDCGGEVEECDESCEQYQGELPAIRALTIKVSGKWARCRSCGRRVRGRYPRQTSDAIGAAAAQVGPRPLAFAGDHGRRLQQRLTGAHPPRHPASAIGSSSTRSARRSSVCSPTTPWRDTSRQLAVAYPAANSSTRRSVVVHSTSPASSLTL